MKYEILHGDCIEMMRTLPEKSVHCCITSPPYYGLRDYGHDGQIGLEETPDAYVAKMVDVFREVRRVLRDDGTVWLNLGDSYAAGKSGRDDSGDNGRFGGTRLEPKQRKAPIGLKPKDLIGIPWRVAFALQSDGWYLRQDIIWHKPNPMPESVTDRCTKAHEYIFLLSKQTRYYYDAEAVKEPIVKGANRSTFHKGKTATHQKDRSSKKDRVDAETRNRRSVWTVTTKPYKGAHFATFPPDLIEPCILAGSPSKCCAKCGKGYKATITKKKIERHRKNAAGEYIIGSGRGGNKAINTAAGIAVTIDGYEPDCDCNITEYIPSTVIDPFGGSGTTAQVAISHGRNAILCEINEKYIELAHKRIKGTQINMPL